MYSSPYIFFHDGKGHRWAKGTDPALQKLDTLNDASKELLPSLIVNVSEPDSLMTWLGTNSAALISDLFIFVRATSFAPSPQRWCLLFDKLQREATNIQHLSVYWDAEGPWGTKPPWNLDDPLHFGLGQSVVFVRGLALLKVKRSVEISGLYAVHWPTYLEEKIGLMPVNKQNLPGTPRNRSLRDYQKGTERLNPWTNGEDDWYGPL